MRAGCIAQRVFLFQTFEMQRGGASTERLKSGAIKSWGKNQSSARRDPPPLRFGAALFCEVSRVEISRDVGLAESGLRPTGPAGPICHLSFRTPYRCLDLNLNRSGNP